MSDNYYINFSEEVEENLLKIYKEACEKLSENLSKLKEELVGICEDTKFERIVQAYNSMVELFDSQIKDYSTRVFDEWLDGSGNFVAAARKMEAGDDAEKTANGIQNRIKEQFSEFWANKALGEQINIDTSRGHLTSNDYENMKDALNKSGEEIEASYDEVKSQIDGESDSDATYTLLKPPVTALFEPMKNAFQRFADIVKNSIDTAEEKKASQENLNEEAIQEALSTSATAEEIADLLKIYENDS